MGEDLEMVTRVFVCMGRGSDGDQLSVGWKGDWSNDFGAGGHGVFKNFGGCVVYHSVVIGFEFDSDAGEGFWVLICHVLKSEIMNDNKLWIIKKPSLTRLAKGNFKLSIVGLLASSFEL
jgi:hypothetical protein